MKRTELRRNTEIERTPFRYSPVARKSLAKKPRARSWHEARAKVEREGICRVCGSVDALQAAHSVARAVQDVKVEDKSFLRVNPDSVIPLCPSCHMAFDSRRLSLLGLLTLAELRNAVGACRRAKIDCRRRLGGGRT